MDDPGASGTKMETSNSDSDEKKLLDQLGDLVEEGETWYLIPIKWFEKWESFMKDESTENPGPIDNAALLEGEDSVELKVNLVDEIDYRIVPEEVWKELHRRYGLTEGQKPIARKAITAGTFAKQAMVEVYPPVVKMKLYGNNDRILREPFSRVTTLDVVHKKMKELFEIPESTETRIFIEDSVDLIKEDRTLDEQTIGSTTTLVLEKQNSDGTWQRTTTIAPPTYNEATSSTSTSSKSIKQKSSYSSSYNGSYGTRSSSSWYGSSRDVKPGLCGLSNLGNTCFMNSALQCLSNVPPLTMYFQDKKYKEHLNYNNPIGMGGKLAESYATLIHDMWDGRSSSVAPREFKYNVSKFAPQFSGYQQHDSQELLAFLIDGLHEDLNRIDKKPYIELEDSYGKKDELVAKQAWDNHLRRNNSVIVDMFHGLFKSTIVCPDCDRVSVTFDPFGFLSLPLPKARDMLIICTFVPRDSKKPVTKYKLSLPKECSVKELYAALAEKADCNAKHLVLADIYNHRFYKIFRSTDKLTSYNSRDDLFVYELGFDDDEDDELSYARVTMRHSGGERFSTMRLFAHPFLIPVKRGQTTYRKFYNSVLSAVSRYVKKEFRDDVKMLSELKKFELNESMGSDVDGNEVGDATKEQSETEEEEEIKWFRLVQMDHTETSVSKELQDDNKPIKFTNETRFSAEWETKVCEEYAVSDWSDTFEKDSSMNELPSKEGISLLQCMTLFTTSEKLGVHDEWYCPSCKEHKQATKKFDLWALPPILIIHLKRFSYTRWSRDKIGSYVDFPIRDLDFSDFIINPAKNQWKPTQQKYNLIGVSNHYGSLGGGHYTAYALNYKENKWYYFDDSSVSESSEDNVKTKAAYMLMYQRQDMEDWVKKGGKDNFVFLESMVSPRATQSDHFHFNEESSKAQQRNQVQNGSEEQETAMETD